MLVFSNYAKNYASTIYTSLVAGNLFGSISGKGENSLAPSPLRVLGFRFKFLQDVVASPDGESHSSVGWITGGSSRNHST